MESKTDIQNAQKWACNPRTLRTWRLAGAPLGNPKAMLDWLASRKHLPPNTIILLAKRRQANAIKGNAREADNTEGLDEGVASALKRLEGEERRSYNEYARAKAEGDQIAIKLAHGRWHKDSHALREFDAFVAQNRRDTGQLVPREEVLHLLYELRDGYRQALSSMTSIARDIVGLKDPCEVAFILDQACGFVTSGVVSYLQRAQKQPIAAWMVQACQLGDFPLKGDEEAWAQFWCVMQGGLKAVSTNARESLDRRNEAVKKWRECADPVERARIWNEELNIQL